MKRILLNVLSASFALFFVLSTAVAQNNDDVTGRVLDGDTNEPLPGANVVIQGTTIGVNTDIDGQFKLPVGANNFTIEISFIGFKSKLIRINEGDSRKIGDVKLESGIEELSTIEVIASVAIDRQTPVAVSTIKRKEIEQKIGSQEFPEILKSTPGVYATKTGGGFGDGRVNIRGFDDDNVAVLINGVPVNDMENGNVYWSNWAGLTDATQQMQVQRGLGASKVAVPSVGGTINIISKASDMEEGGNVFTSTGNDAYRKVGFSLSSGLQDNGWAFTVSGSRTQGDGYVDGTEFLGFAYYANIAKQFNNQHEVTFTAIGAKQRHGQRQSTSSLEDYERAPSGIKYNPDWGYKNGQVVNIEDNFYHKPQLSLNHYWTISNSMDITTSAYASFGSGGGGGTGGDFSKDVTVGGEFSPVDIDYFVEENLANPTGEATSWLRASRNDHKWYGVLSSMNYDLNSSLSFLGGVDLRYYRGSHFYEITDLLGGEYILNNDDINNPNRVLREGDKYNYNYDGIVWWQGLFGQLEYTQGDLSAFFSGAVSNTSYSRVEYFEELEGNQESAAVNFIGYQAKGGANYNLNRNHNVFANVGYFERAPFFRNVFLSRSSNDANADAVNEKIFSAELGYGYRSSKLTANVNVYYTKWMDKAEARSQATPNDEIVFANILGIDALHQGIEFDAKYELLPNLSFSGMLSLGDWRWLNDIENVVIQDEDGNVLGNPVNIYISGLRVGDAAQTTAALGVQWDAMRGLSFAADYNFYDNLFASFDPTSRTSTDAGDAWKVPAYGVVDLNATYEFYIGDLRTSIFGNIYNLTDTEFVADANDGGNAANSRVYYGYGRNWNLGLKINF